MTPVHSPLFFLNRRSIASSRASDVLMFFPKVQRFKRWLNSDQNSRIRQAVTDNQKAFMTESIENHKKTFDPDAEPRDLIDVYLKEISRTENSDSSFFKEEGGR